VVAGRWSGLSDALTEIQQNITTGVATSGATWEGTAADAARYALAPLGDWAEQAAAAADTMRMSTELQGGLLAKARADMPPPVPVTAEQPNSSITAIAHLFGFQTDHEIQEAASNAAEQRAFQVMAEYEASTSENTSTLGDFGMPPALVVDTSAMPPAGAARAGEPIGSARGARGRVPGRTAGNRATVAEDPIVATEPEAGARTAAPSAKATTPAGTEPAGTEPTGAQPGGPAANPAGRTAVDVPATRKSTDNGPADPADDPTGGYLVSAEGAVGGDPRVAPRVIGE
jgi:hypothetical protein